MLRLNTQWFTTILLAVVLTACGTNPVTKKREFQFVSEAQEISIGKQNYSPARQSQGGDYILDPELTAYVQEVGHKLAKVSDRQLPYEFVVINDSVPNAWAMPGGKIAFNRGLLYELNSEAELAAVMGHEIVHAAARHGAKGMERGIFLQGAMIAVGIGAQNSDYANLIVGGAQIGAQLISSRYGRSAESESDLYGMQYMKAAGYDPAAAVTLQETFVRLSANRQSSFIDGLFASHPPSAQRVSDNKETLKTIGAGGFWGKEVYAQKTARLRRTKPAYDAYDQGVKALKSNEIDKARQLAKKAIKIEPKEARFQELLGDIAMSQKQAKTALGFYNKAIKLQPDYFKPHVQGGIALYKLGRKAEAEKYLTKANSYLPTAPGHYLLGEIAESRGDMQAALKNYGTAAGSNSEIGQRSKERYVRLDFPNNPQKYLRAGARADNRGQIYAVLQNPTPVDVAAVQFRVVRVEPRTGRSLGQSRPYTLRRGLAAKQSERVRIDGARVNSTQEASTYRVVIEGARLAQ